MGGPGLRGISNEWNGLCVKLAHVVSESIDEQMKQMK